MGRMLAGVVGAGGRMQVQGWDAAVTSAGGGGVLILGAHLGPWEATAAELARRGRSPLVVAAPWPSLPLSEAALNSLRARRSVRALPRCAGTFREATAALRAAGTVVVLIDGVSPRRRGRRPRPWVIDSLAAPDGLVGWALRHGAAVWVAEGTSDGAALHVLAASGESGRAEPNRVRKLADRAVALLERAVRRRPHTWAWVRPLAALALAWTTGCAELPAPLPLAAESWDARLEGVTWEGRLDEYLPRAATRFFAESARVRWVGDSPVGRFNAVEITLPRADGEPSDVRIEAASAEGRWPQGPIALDEVSWEAQGVPGGRVGRLTRRSAEGDVHAGWECGGCDLEPLLTRVGR